MLDFQGKVFIPKLPGSMRLKEEQLITSFNGPDVMDERYLFKQGELWRSRLLTKRDLNRQWER
jgi:hypothetical protein